MYHDFRLLQWESSDLITVYHYTGNILFQHFSTEPHSSVVISVCRPSNACCCSHEGTNRPRCVGPWHKQTHSATWTHSDWSVISLLRILTSCDTCVSIKNRHLRLLTSVYISFCVRWIPLRFLSCFFSSLSVFLLTSFNPLFHFSLCRSIFGNFFSFFCQDIDEKIMNLQQAIN